MGNLIVEFEDWEKVLQETISAPLQDGYSGPAMNCVGKSAFPRDWNNPALLTPPYNSIK